MSSMLLNRFGVLLALGLTLGLGACDNPVGDEHEEHPVGLVVLNAQGQQVASSVGATVTGQIAVPVGTTTFTVFAVGEDGDRLAIDGEEFELRATVGDLATAAVQSNNRVAVTATQTGTGVVQLMLLHEGHEEFRSLFPLVVGS